LYKRVVFALPPIPAGKQGSEGGKKSCCMVKRGRHYPLLIRDQFRREKENNIDTTLESLDISFIAELLYSFI
jgi:hypothetical protein